MDLRESIKSIVTGETDFNQEFLDCLSEHLEKVQLITEDDKIDNIPVNLPGNDIEDADKAESEKIAEDEEEKDPELDLNLDGEEPVEEGLIGGVLGAAAGACLGGIPGAAAGYVVGDNATD